MSNNTLEAAVLLEDLDQIRTTLASCLNYFQSADLATAQLKLADRMQYSPLTNEVGQALERVEGLIADRLLQEHLDEDEEEDAEDAPAAE